MVTSIKGNGSITIVKKENILMPMERLKKLTKVRLMINGKMGSLCSLMTITPSMRAATSTTKNTVKARLLILMETSACVIGLKVKSKAILLK